MSGAFFLVHHIYVHHRMCIQGKARKIFFRCIHHFNRVKTLRNFSVFLLKVLKLFHLLDLFKHLLSHSLLQKYHCAKNVQIWSFFWPIFCHIWTEYRKIRTRKKFAFGNFLRSVCTAPVQFISSSYHE